jgi:chromosome segregation ATPase
MDLSSLKHKCSSYTGQINSINHNIDKLRRQIEALKSQIAIHNNDTGFITKTIREKKIQYGHLKSKVEDAQFDKSRLLSMISDRKV